MKYLIIVSRTHISHINKSDLYTLKTLSFSESSLFRKVIILSIPIVILFNLVILLSLQAIILLVNASKVLILTKVTKLNIHLSKYIKGIISGNYKAALVVPISLLVKLLAITIIIKLVVLNDLKLDFIVFLVLSLKIRII
jgi:hypothetical protein